MIFAGLTFAFYAKVSEKLVRGDSMFHALLRVWPRLRSKFSARLSGVNGFTGRGAVNYSSTKAGVKKLSVNLRGLAGREANLFADQSSSVPVPIINGRARATFVSKKGDKVPSLTEGARIDVHQNGDVILSGVLTRN